MTEAERLKLLGIEPIGNENNNMNRLKETLLYLIKCDEEVQEAIKKFIL